MIIRDGLELVYKGDELPVRNFSQLVGIDGDMKPGAAFINELDAGFELVEVTYRFRPRIGKEDLAAACATILKNHARYRGMSGRIKVE